MDLLFKREQGTSTSGNATFKLWSKVELDEDEQAIVEKYKFDKAVLIDANQEGLLRQSIFVGIGVTILCGALLYNVGAGFVLAIIAGIVAGYFWHDKRREKIFVKDLLHGRHFSCDSVVNLAKKEAFVVDAVTVLRQVMESAKHWDGTERHSVDALPKEDAKQLIIRYG